MDGSLSAELAPVVVGESRCPDGTLERRLVDVAAVESVAEVDAGAGATLAVDEGGGVAEFVTTTLPD